MNKIESFFQSELLITHKERFDESPLKSLEHFILNGLEDREFFDSKHDEKKLEFLITRTQASFLYKKLTQKICYHFPTQSDRSPLFPRDVVGSFSHSKDVVCTAMSLRSKTQYLGVDIESLGRYKPELDRIVKNQWDLGFVKELSHEELSTLIFSAKESLYKTLYPAVKKFFGFSDASCTQVLVSSKFPSEICGNKVRSSGTLTLVLNTDLAESFVKGTTFTGKWLLFDDFLLTIIELNYN